MNQQIENALGGYDPYMDSLNDEARRLRGEDVAKLIEYLAGIQPLCPVCGNEDAPRALPQGCADLNQQDNPKDALGEGCKTVDCPFEQYREGFYRMYDGYPKADKESFLAGVHFARVEPLDQASIDEAIAMSCALDDLVVYPKVCADSAVSDFPANQLIVEEYGEDYPELLEKAAALIEWLTDDPLFEGFKHPQQAQWWDEIKEALEKQCDICGDYDCEAWECRMGNGI